MQAHKLCNREAPMQHRSSIKALACMWLGQALLNPGLQATFLHKCLGRIRRCSQEAVAYPISCLHHTAPVKQSGSRHQQEHRKWIRTCSSSASISSFAASSKASISPCATYILVVSRQAGLPCLGEMQATCWNCTKRPTKTVSVQTAASCDRACPPEL